MWDLDSHGIRHGYNRCPVRPGGSKHQSFVTRIENASNADIQRLYSGRGDDELTRWIEFQSVQFLVITRQRFSQGWKPRILGVKRKAVGHGLLGRPLDVFRRRQIRFTEI